MPQAAEEIALEIVVQGMKKFLDDMKEADAATEKQGKSWEGLGRIVGRAAGVLGTVAKVGLAAVASGAVAAAGAVVGLGAAMFKLAVDAAPLEGIGRAFETMAGKAGLALSDLRSAASGTISDFDLMRSANVALAGAGDDLGQAFGRDMPRLLEVARAAARATGEDAGFLFESLVTGIKRVSPMLIDNTGLQLKLGEANQALADSLGITVDELTGEQQQIALLNATLEAGQAMVDDFGGGQLTAAERMAQFKAQVQNTKDQIGVALLPALSALMGPLGQLAEAIGPKVVAIFEQLSPVISAFVNWLGFAITDGDTLNDWLTHLPEPLRVVAEGIGQILDVLRPFVEWLIVAVTEGDVLNDWLTHLPEPIQTLILGILALGETIQGWFAENGPTIMESFGEIWDIIWTGIQDIADKFISWWEENLPLIQETVQVILDFFMNHVLPVLDIVWTIIVEIVIAAIDIVLGVIKLVMQVITGDWEGAWETIKETLLGVWESIKTIVEEFIEGVANAVGRSLDDIKRNWGSVWDNLVTIVTTIVGRIKQKVGEFADAGRDLINGIKEGILSAASGLVDSLVGAVTNAIAAAKAAIGASSPSMVTRMLIGQPLGQGIAAGIADLAPTIQAQLAAASMPGGAGAVSNVSNVHTVNNEFNLTAQSVMRPGGLEQEFAAMGMASR